MKPAALEHLPETSPISIVLRAERRVLPALLVHDLSRRAIQQAESDWQALRATAMPYGEQAEGSPPETAHGDWIAKRREIDETLGQVCAVVAGYAVQGMLMYLYQAQASRRPEKQHLTNLYVEYLETAPANNVRFVGQQARYGLVGTRLLAAAAEVSRLLHADGHLGLHALPGALGFYEDWGFIDLGVDESAGLHYLQLWPDAYAEQHGSQGDLR